MKKILLMLILSLSIFMCVGCGDKTTNTNNGGNPGTKADLKITFFNGGYGEDWINNLVARFEAAKGVKVEIVKSEEGNCGAENFIKSGYNLSDIYIGEGIPWKSLVQSGLLAELSDVYEAEVEIRSGMKKIKDFMDPLYVGYFYSQRQLSKAEYTPWAMPWTVQPNAFAYNEDILLAVKHVSTIEVTEGCVGESGLWVKPPETVQDLYAFSEDVIAFNNNSPEKQALGDTHTYVPFGFAGGINIDSIGFPIITWWAEAQGLTTSNYAGEGSFYDLFNYGNTTNSNVGQTVDMNVFKQTGLKLAYNTFANYILDASGNYQNTLSNPYNNNLQQLQQLFVANKVNEKPVIVIASSYLENEVIKNRYIDSDLDGKQDVNFKFMNVPKLNPDSDDILWGRISDVIVVPAKAPHLALAKEFLIFMSSEQEVDNFAKDTNGGIRPFSCDLRTTVTGTEYSAFATSLFDVYYNSTKFFEYPANTTSYAQVAHVYRYNDPSYHGNVTWTDILNNMRDPKGKTPGDYIADLVVERLTRDELDTWIRKFKLTNITK